MGDFAENQPTNPEKNRKYQTADQLAPELWDDLAALKPAEVRQRSLTGGEDGLFDVPFLDALYRLDPGKREVRDVHTARVPDFQTGLVLINYLIHASEEGIDGRMVPPREIPGGDLFFQGPHALLTGPVTRRFERDAAGFLENGLLLGGDQVSGGDAAFRLWALPKLPVAYSLYEADDEFGAELTITIDANAGRHLPLDSIWALINVVSLKVAGKT